jgi:1-acyl-sn-glycerol-3-phosphate acyltransferase
MEYVSTGEGDYSKWLGPDWKPQWEGSGTLIANHVCWLDIAIFIATFFPSFVSKASVKSYPLIGKIGVAIDCFFIERASSKEERAKALKAIEDRQEENEKTGRRPILIFPEGATTNNESVLPFKKGPFSGLNSVQPIGLKYWSANGVSP